MRQQHIVVFLLMVFKLCYSQNSISGKIRSAVNNSPISGCHVHINNKSVSTNSAGDFAIKNLPAGLVPASIYAIGYVLLDTTLTITGNTRVDFILKEKINLLNEVVITHKANSYNQSIMEQKIKSETIDRYSSQTLGDALKEVTGVSILKTGNNISKPIINGLHSNRVLLIANNIKLEDQQWGSDHSSSFDVNAASKISVIKGASALEYGGDAIGGMVLIEPNLIAKDTLFGKSMLSLSSNGRGGTLTTSLHKGNDKGWSWNTTATAKYFGDRESGDYVLSNTGNRELNFTGDARFSSNKYNFSILYSLYNSKIGILRSSHIGNSTDLEKSINNKQPSINNDFTYSIQNPGQEVQHHVLKMHYQNIFDETSLLDTQYSLQLNNRLEFDIRRQSYNKLPALDLQLYTHNFIAYYKKSYHDWNIKTGTSGSFQSNFSNPATNIQPLIPSFDKIDASWYGLANYKFHEATTFEAGIRYDFSKIRATKFYKKSRWNDNEYSPTYDHFIVKEDDNNQLLTKPTFNFHSISASIGVFKEFRKNFDMYLNLSLTSRNPNPSELFSDGLHHSTGSIEIGNLGLSREQSLKFGLTIKKKWTDFSMSMNPYLHNIEDFIFSRPVGIETTIRGAFPVWNFEKTDAFLTGLDFDTHLKLDENWDHYLGVAYVCGQNKIKEIPLIDMPPLNVTNRITFSKKDWNHFMFELRSEWVFKQKRYPNYNFETLIVDNNALKSVEVDVSTPPKAYHLMHAYSEIKIGKATKSSTTLGFSVQNIFNVTYRDYLNRQRYFADDLGINFQLQLKINY